MNRLIAESRCAVCVCVCVCKNRAKPSAEAANERKSHGTLKEEKKREAKHKRLRSIDRVRANKSSILLREGLVSVNVAD